MSVDTAYALIGATMSMVVLGAASWADQADRLRRYQRLRRTCPDMPRRRTWRYTR